jgi:hypothetical protein
MSDTGASVEREPVEFRDRRLHPRQQVRSLAYVKLDEGNGGIILNASEGGLAVQAVTSVMDDVLPTVSFQLAQSRSWVQLRARTAWTGDSRKVAGLEFLDLSEETRTQIREWLSSEGAPPPFQAEREAPPEDRVRDGAQHVESTEVPHSPAAQASTTPPPAEAFAATSEEPHHAERNINDQPGVEASHSSGPLASRKTLLAAFAVIALIVFSLAAGWSVGHGTFSNLLQKIPSLTWRNNNSGDLNAIPQSAGRIAQISQIEIVDANNQRWAISFNGPMSISPQIPRWQTSGRAPTPVPPPRIPFQTWVLSPPVRANSAGTGSDPEKENASALGNLPSGAENASNGSLGLPAPSPLTSPQPAPPAHQPSSELKRGELIRRVEPIYPAVARDHGIGGIVKLRLIVGPDGIVRGVEFVSGPQVLVGAAKTAVLQWRYTPTVLDGKAIETENEVSLVFQSSPR